jgi:hypothetical protein
MINSWLNISTKVGLCSIFVSQQLFAMSPTSKSWNHLFIVLKQRGGQISGLANLSLPTEFGKEKD